MDEVLIVENDVFACLWAFRFSAVRSWQSQTGMKTLSHSLRFSAYVISHLMNLRHLRATVPLNECLVLNHGSAVAPDLELRGLGFSLALLAFFPSVIFFCFVYPK